MAVEYILVNQTKKEKVSFLHLPGAKKRELAGGVASSSVVTWYLLNNQGDDIQFVSDTYNDWPFSKGKREDITKYPDKTFEILEELIKEGILKDEGMSYIDEDEPDTVYIKRYINVWEENN